MKSETIASRKKGWLQFKKIKRFHSEEDGASMIEFSLVALPFFYLLGSIFEFTLRFFAQTLMDHAAADVARLIRTKQISPAQTTEQQLQDMVCNRPGMAIFQCNNLTVDVQLIASFGTPTVPTNNDGSLNNVDMGFNPGGSNSINVMRFYYDWPTFMPWQQPLSVGATPTGHLLVATQAFMIEP